MGFKGFFQGNAFRHCLLLALRLAPATVADAVALKWSKECSDSISSRVGPYPDCFRSQRKSGRPRQPPHASRALPVSIYKKKHAPVIPTGACPEVRIHTHLKRQAALFQRDIALG